MSNSPESAPSHPEQPPGVSSQAMLARVRVLADQWNETPDYTPSAYDQGRVDQRHDMTMQLLEALGEHVSDVESEAASILAEQFDEWLFRMHGVTSSCDHRTEGQAMAQALAQAGLLAP